MTDKKSTKFAPAERATSGELLADINFLSRFPVVMELLHLESGLLGVLNEKRQFIAVNNKMLKSHIGIENNEALGLRPGEAVNCKYSDEHTGGCGTSEFCTTCGAAIAIVGSIDSDQPMEKNCSIIAKRGDKEEDIFLRVLSCPVKIEGRRFILLFAQDISHQHRWAILEKVFLHDMSNVLTSMVLALELLERRDMNDKAAMLIDDVRQMASQMAREIEIQKILMGTENLEYKPGKSEATVAKIMGDIEKLLSSHPAAREKNIKFPEFLPEANFEVDTFLLKRVLSNMVLNALEASDKGEEVKVSFRDDSGKLEFSVWNGKSIPKEVQKRIFQRNFSTKHGMGRGLGTYSMKLFGEEFMGGKVDFTTCEKQGTVFTLSIPK